MNYNSGDEIDVVIDRDSLADGAGIAHLPDDTMVVIVGAASRVGEPVHATIIGIEKMRLGTSVVASVK